ncbi:hypothetical protein Tco_0636018 [Tanacetum coccineum]
MERDCQHGLYKAGMGSSRVLSDFAEKYGSKNRVLAGFGIGGKSGKEKFMVPAGSSCWELLRVAKTPYSLGVLQKGEEEYGVQRIIVMTCFSIVFCQAGCFVISNRGRLLGFIDLKITKPIRRNEERRNNEGPNM